LVVFYYRKVDGVTKIGYQLAMENMADFQPEDPAKDHIELSDVEDPAKFDHGKILIALYGRNDVTKVVADRYSSKSNKFSAQNSEFTDKGKILYLIKELTSPFFFQKF
jgi:hypothetical protein